MSNPGSVLEFPLVFVPDTVKNQKYHVLQIGSQRFKLEDLTKKATLAPLTINQGKITSLNLQTPYQNFESRTTGDEDVTYAILTKSVFLYLFLFYYK